MHSYGSRLSTTNHSYGSLLSATNYNITTSKWNCATLVLNEMLGNGLIWQKVTLWPKLFLYSRMCPFISVTIQVDRQVIGIIIMFLKTLLYINAIETVAVVSYLLVATVAQVYEVQIPSWINFSLHIPGCLGVYMYMIG